MLQVWFYHPENAEAILSSNSLISKSEEYVYLEPWLGTGLLLSTHDSFFSAAISADNPINANNSRILLTACVAWQGSNSLLTLAVDGMRG